MSLMNKIHRLFHLISPVKALPMNAEVSFFEFFQSLLHHFVNNLLINAIALHFFLPFFSRSAKTIRNTAKTRRKITSSARIIFSFYIFISYFSLFSWHYPKNMLLYLSVNRMRTKYAEIFRHCENRKTTNI